MLLFRNALFNYVFYILQFRRIIAASVFDILLPRNANIQCVLGVDIFENIIRRHAFDMLQLRHFILQFVCCGLLQTVCVFCLKCLSGAVALRCVVAGHVHNVREMGTL